MKFFICLSLLISIVYGSIIFPKNYEFITVRTEDGPFIKEVKNEIIKQTDYIQNQSKNLINFTLDKYINKIKNLTNIPTHTAFTLANCAKQLNDEIDVSLPIKAFSNCALITLEDSQQLFANVSTIVDEFKNTGSIFTQLLEKCNEDTANNDEINRCVLVGSGLTILRTLPLYTNVIIPTSAIAIRLFTDARKPFEECIEKKKIAIVQYFGAHLETTGQCVLRGLTE